MLAAESKVVAAGVADVPHAERACSWKHIVEPVEPFLEAVNRRLARQVTEFDPNLAQYAEYALNGHGKHLRPTLVALAANSLDRVNDSHVTVAVIIEMVHLATLVHDDVMDEAEVRRGQLTLAANWGNEIAVLFGDCLFAQALKLAAGFPTPEICRAVAMATNTVCSGEILQTQHRRNFDRSRREYFRVLEMKTAELFALSCDLAACLSTATSAQRAALRQFGLTFGTAERATAGDRAKLEALVQNWQPGSLPRVSELLARYETLGPTVEIIGQYLDQARETLRSLPESDGRAGLFGVTEYLARQTGMLSE